MNIDKIQETIIEKNVSEELIWLTVSKYALFMSYGKIGIDSMALYCHYQFTACLQKTNSVWALDTYCREGLDWGRDRFENAKKLLSDLGIVTYVRKRDGNGLYTKLYVKLKRGIADLEPNNIDHLSENPQVDLPTSGKTATNSLSNNINALSNNVKPSTKVKRKMIRILPNSLDEVSKHIREKNYIVDPNDFYTFFTEGNWVDSYGNEVYNWKQKLFQWNKRELAKRANNPKTSKLQLVGTAVER